MSSIKYKVRLEADDKMYQQILQQYNDHIAYRVAAEVFYIETISSSYSSIVKSVEAIKNIVNREIR